MAYALRGSDRYDMTGKRVALMLCVMETNIGAYGDIQVMGKFFQDFGFVSEIVRGKSVEHMRKKLTSFRDGINHSHEDISCVFVVTSSHGDRDGILDPSNKVLPVAEIIQCFSEQQCPRLKGKPKIFMFEACRGHLQDPGVSANRERDHYLKKELKKQMERDNHRAYMSTFQSPWIHDMLVIYPTRPDFVAWMTSDGANMIVKMAEVFASADTDNEQLPDLFAKVNKKMVDEHIRSRDGIRKNVMTIESTLTKSLYLGRRRCHRHF